MTSAQYLQTAKIEELASRLKADGYRVVVGEPGQDDGYDLVAERGSEKLAIEVKERGSLNPFSFDVLLGLELHIKRAYDIQVDTSSYAE